MNIRRYKVICCLCTFLFSVLVNITAEGQEVIDIKDYFPSQIGASWSYVSGIGESLMNVMCMNTGLDNNDGGELYLFSEIYPQMGATSVLYGLKNNKVVALSGKTIVGQYYQNQEPFPVVLASPHNKGEYIDKGDICHYVTSIATCKYDDKTFKDCILIEEKIMLNDKPIRTKKSYYAKGIGLVYVTLIDDKKNDETVFMKLIKSSLLK